MIEALTRLEQGCADPATAIEEGSLPFEAVLPRVASGDIKVWTVLLTQAPYMFMLRSLHAFGRARLWEDNRLVDSAAARVKDPHRVAKAMQFPFRYYQAAKVLEGARTPSMRRWSCPSAICRIGARPTWPWREPQWRAARRRRIWPACSRRPCGRAIRALECCPSVALWHGGAPDPRPARTRLLDDLSPSSRSVAGAERIWRRLSTGCKRRQRPSTSLSG